MPHCLNRGRNIPGSHFSSGLLGSWTSLLVLCPGPLPTPHPRSVKQVQNVYRTQMSNLCRAQWRFKFHRLSFCFAPSFRFSFITYSLGTSLNLQNIYNLAKSHALYIHNIQITMVCRKEKNSVKCSFVDYLPWAKHHSQKSSSPQGCWLLLYRLWTTQKY